MPSIARTAGLLADQLIHQAPAARRLEPASRPSPMLGNVVVVDDSRIDRALHSRALSRSGVIGEMIDFADAATALRYLQQKPKPRPDAIFLDVNMPGMDAFDFLSAATDALGTACMPDVVILTSIPLLQRDQDRLTVFDVVRHFMEKPLQASDIRSLASKLNS